MQWLSVTVLMYVAVT